MRCGLLENETVRPAQLRHHVFQQVVVRSGAANACAGAASGNIELTLPDTSIGLAAEDSVQAEHRR